MHTEADKGKSLVKKTWGKVLVAAGYTDCAEHLRHSCLIWFPNMICILSVNRSSQVFILMVVVLFYSVVYRCSMGLFTWNSCSFFCTKIIVRTAHGFPYGLLKLATGRKRGQIWETYEIPAKKCRSLQGPIRPSKRSIMLKLRQTLVCI